MSATPGLVDSVTLHVLHSKYPKNERNTTRSALASNRGGLGVLWTYSGSGVVLSWDLTHKKTRKQAHYRHTHVASLTLTIARRSTQTHAQRHKFDKNIPVNLAKTAIAALPFLY